MKARAIACVAILALLASGCGQTRVPRKVPRAQCLVASPELVAQLSSKLLRDRPDPHFPNSPDRVISGARIRFARAVASDELDPLPGMAKGWFVSGFIEGPGIVGWETIGVWATDRLDGTGKVYSVEWEARYLSGWDDAGVTGSTAAVKTIDMEASRLCTQLAKRPNLNLVDYHGPVNTHLKPDCR